MLLPNHIPYTQPYVGPDEMLQRAQQYYQQLNTRRTLREFTPTRNVARRSSRSLPERGGNGPTEDDTEAKGEDSDEGRHGG